MLDHQSTFDGTFLEGCIEDAIPTSLLQFVGMVEHDANIVSAQIWCFKDTCRNSTVATVQLLCKV